MAEGVRVVLFYIFRKIKLNKFIQKLNITLWHKTIHLNSLDLDHLQINVSGFILVPYILVLSGMFSCSKSNS